MAAEETSIPKKGRRPIDPKRRKRALAITADPDVIEYAQASGNASRFFAEAGREVMERKKATKG